MKLSKALLTESNNYLEKLATKLSGKFSHLSFDVKFGERIDVRGSQQDLATWGDKYDNQILGDYKVFHTQDDDRGDIVRIIRKD